MSPHDLHLLLVGGLAGLFSGGLVADAIVTRRRRYVGVLTIAPDGSHRFYMRPRARLPAGDYSVWTSKP